MRLAVRVTPFSSTITIPGEIRDFAPGEVSILLEISLPIGSLVDVSLMGRAAFVGEILSCRPSQGNYQTNIRINETAESGLRSTPRFTVKLPAQIFAPRANEPLPAIIIDISGAGLGLELPVSLSVGEAVAIDSEANIAFGTIRHCRAVRENLFRAGVQLHDVIQKTDSSGSGLVAKFRSLTGL